MIIEGNEKEKAAMAEFHKGNRKEGLRLQEEFAAAFREEYKEKDSQLHERIDQQETQRIVRTDGAYDRI